MDASQTTKTDVLVIEDAQGNFYIVHHAMLAKNHVPAASAKKLEESLAHLHKTKVEGATLDKATTKYHIANQFSVVSSQASLQHLQDVLRML